MSTYAKLSKEACRVLKAGGVWVPCPLPLDKKKEVNENDLRLLLMYYIKSGARCVVPGAHTGEFCGYGLLTEEKHFELYDYWLKVVKAMTLIHGKNMILMSMVHSMRHVELSVKNGYDIVVISPKCFKRFEGNVKKQIQFCKDAASQIPVFGFYLQKKAGGIDFPAEFWQEFFKFSYGAKLAPFDRYRTLTALEKAALSKNRENLTIVTGNDDHIVGDLMRDYTFSGKTVTMGGGLLGHYATDTHAAVKWTAAVRNYKAGKKNWPYKISINRLLDTVTLCNMALFDAFPNNFKNSTWGVKSRLTSLGVLSSPQCYKEGGYEALEKEISKRYDGEFKAVVSDRDFIKKNISNWKKEAGLK
ncbi:MAG: hypothetical protein A2231_00160 [Candidatus Firestonebacteria bacterium RIFOXYA2_FULL_40_8]|nr:MAG: hypothetical protein A2231_00160 [Candidatus Firestonebacteria bacterium RIFOXYA2_FULL_40_8]